MQVHGKITCLVITYYISFDIFIPNGSFNIRSHGYQIRSFNENIVIYKSNNNKEKVTINEKKLQ